ncbi:MAG: hypothetical protein ACXWUP_05110 [Allosphingosinicella sp.]
MFGLFGSRLPIEEDELEFQLATFKWLIREFDPVEQSALVLPTPEYFPSVAKQGWAPAEALFEDVRRAADMADWPCRLEPGDGDRPIDGGSDHLIRTVDGAAPCGTFRVEQEPGGHRAVISYNPDMERDQTGLVATFAHELAHYLLATNEKPGPGGWELHELHADLAAVYLGFGIFLANSARTYEVFHGSRGSGWRSQLQGYLSEGALVTATIIFQRLAGRDPLAAAPFLEEHLRVDLRRAARALAKRYPDIDAAVEAVDLAAFGCE